MNKNLLLQQLRQDEGLSLRPYRCTAGKLTIGFGRNLESNGITRDEAEQMLRNDVDEIAFELGSIRQYLFLDPIRQTVLANMAYNMGIPTLKTFRLMLANISLGDYEGAAREMLNSKWARQVGDRAVRLAEIMRTGRAE